MALANMYIYTIPLFCVLAEVFAQKAVRRTAFIAVVGVTVLITGLRWETGTDWQSYYNAYKYVDDFGFREPLFDMLRIAVSRAGMPYAVLLSLSALVSWIPAAILFWRSSARPLLCFCLYYSMIFYYTGAERQLMANGLLICVVLVRSRAWRAIFAVCACLTHISAAAMLVLWWLINIIYVKDSLKLALRICLLMTVGITVLYLTAGVVGEAVSSLLFADGLGVYFNSQDSSSMRLPGFIYRVLILAAILYAPKANSLGPYYEFSIRGSLAFVLIWIAFAPFYSIVVDRFSLYFFAPLCLFVSYLEHFSWKPKLLHGVFVLAIVMSAVFFLWRGHLLFGDLFAPYCGVILDTCEKKVLY